jgi:hypothetical protein
MILTLEKPTADLTNPVVTGRLHHAVESQMLQGWRKNQGAPTGERSGQSERITAAQADTLKAVRVLSERPEYTGVVTLAELHDAIDVNKSTVSGRRDALVAKGFLALDDSRGQGGMVLTPLAFTEEEE